MPIDPSRLFCSGRPRPFETTFAPAGAERVEPAAAVAAADFARRSQVAGPAGPPPYRMALESLLGATNALPPWHTRRNSSFTRWELLSRASRQRSLTRLRLIDDPNTDHWNLRVGHRDVASLPGRRV